jgi:hypothetical protein
LSTTITLFVLSRLGRVATTRTWPLLVGPRAATRLSHELAKHPLGVAGIVWSGRQWACRACISALGSTRLVEVRTAARRSVIALGRTTIAGDPLTFFSLQAPSQRFVQRVGAWRSVAEGIVGVVGPLHCWVCGRLRREDCRRRRGG